MTPKIVDENGSQKSYQLIALRINRNRSLRNINLPYVFLGDGAFELSTHLMKPYPGSHDVGSSKRLFNQHLSGSRVVVENTFGILTSVFRIFNRPMDLDPQKQLKVSQIDIHLLNHLTSMIVVEIWLPLVRGEIKKGYNAMQNFPNVARRSPLNARQIREKITSYFNRNSHVYENLN
nr:unnamed protein product [Callosobruchus analis]